MGRCRVCGRSSQNEKFEGGVGILRLCVCVPVCLCAQEATRAREVCSLPVDTGVQRGRRNATTGGAHECATIVGRSRTSPLPLLPSCYLHTHAWVRSSSLSSIFWSLVAASDLFQQKHRSHHSRQERRDDPMKRRLLDLIHQRESVNGPSPQPQQRPGDAEDGVDILARRHEAQSPEGPPSTVFVERAASPFDAYGAKRTCFSLDDCNSSVSSDSTRFFCMPSAQTPPAHANTAVVSNSSKPKQTISGIQGAFPVVHAHAGGPRAAGGLGYATAKRSEAEDVGLHKMITNDFDLLDEFRNLSLQDQTAIRNDIIGNADAEEETPGLVKSSIESLKTEIARIRDKQEYEQAAFLSPKYVKNHQFQLMFLRADEFCPRKAARRMVAFFRLKTLMFGYEQLARPLRMADLNEDDRNAASTGALQIRSDCRDKAGRAVLLDCMNFRNYTTVGSQMRAMIYILMHHLERDIITQKLGITAIGYMVDSDVSKIFDMRLNMKLPTLINALPMRVGAAHLCFDNSNMAALNRIVIMTMPKEIRLRQTIHFGSHLECQYKLFTVYGIPEHRFFLTENGSMKTADFHAYLHRIELEEGHAADDHEQQRQSQQSQQEKGQSPVHSKKADGGRPAYVAYPTEADVLLGRGRPFRDHTGNVKHRELIRSFQPDYDAADRTTKTVLTLLVINKMKESGGRFLKRASPEELGWETVADSVAQAKTAQTFRNNRKTKKPK